MKKRKKKKEEGCRFTHPWRVNRFIVLFFRATGMTIPSVPVGTVLVCLPETPRVQSTYTVHPRSRLEIMVQGEEASE